MRSIKHLTRDCLPVGLVRWIQKVRPASGESLCFDGDFATWEEANAYCTGYDADEIFKHVRDAALKVKRGEAVFERDSVCFYHEEYRWEVLACLMLGAAKNCGRLNVLDFGGALGSFYIQHKRFFSSLPEHHWGVVEQKHIVECGRNELEEEYLKFYSSVDECVADMSVNLILLSSVLPYLEKPYDLLVKLGELKADYIVVDRMPFIDADKDRVVIHRVQQSIFPATLPMTIFSEKYFDEAMNTFGYLREADFSCSEGTVGEIRFSGVLYKKNKS